MKMTDEQLLAAIWLLQIRVTAGHVLHRHPQGRYSVVYESWFVMSSSIHIMERDRITPLLKRQQLLKRIRSLFQQGSISSEYGSRLLTFYISNDKALQVFLAARQWWTDKGIDDLTLTEAEHKTMLADAENHLLNLFGCEVAA